MITNNFKTHYNEIGQAYKVKFAWVGQNEDKTFFTMHNWVLCRDFLGDHAFWLDTDQKDKSIYSFSLTDKSAKTDLIAVKFPDVANRKYFAINIEKFNLSDLFNVVYIADKEVVIQLRPSQMKTIWQISLLTFLIKIFSYSVNENMDDCFDNAPSTESSYILAVGVDKIKALMQCMEDFKFEDGMALDPKAGTHDIHNNNGFVSVFKKAANNTYSKQLKEMMNALPVL